MTRARDHYERMLARHYTWMSGVPFGQKVAEQAELLREAGVLGPALMPGVAVDLGCGPGFQSLALADGGATRVLAIDTCAALLGELEGRSGGRPITVHRMDLLAFGQLLDGPVRTIVCMGDTLTHLERSADVAALLRESAGWLSEGGSLVLSWRDLSRAPSGLDRFLPVRSTDERVMLCFLEDQGDTVLVHDLVHVRGAEGWRLEKSAYPKLKLSPAWVAGSLRAAGLVPRFERTVRGMTVLAATRPAGAARAASP